MDILYGIIMFVLQLVVVVMVIVVFFFLCGCRFGVIVLIVMILFNVVMVGGMSVLQIFVLGNYEGVKIVEQKYVEVYFGIKGEDLQEVFFQQLLEEVCVQFDVLFVDICVCFIVEFGYMWIEVGDEDLCLEWNGYGGGLMFIEYMFMVWVMNELVQGYDCKFEVMVVISEEVVVYGFWDFYFFNDLMNFGIDFFMIVKFYGSDDLCMQMMWEYYIENFFDLMCFYVNIYDLLNDRDGGFWIVCEVQSVCIGELIEGLQLVVVVSGVFSEVDCVEFEERLQDYFGFEQVVVDQGVRI